MKSDPKFGWHIYWIAPLVVLSLTMSKVRGVISRWWRELTLTSEQRKLQVLAGIRKSKK